VGGALWGAARRAGGAARAALFGWLLTLLTAPCGGRGVAGTTVRRTMELARSRLVGKPGSGALLSGVEQRALTYDDARRAVEIFFVAGDTHLYAVRSLDGNLVGDGGVGPVAAAVRLMLEADAAHGDEFYQVVPGV
jgi:branched-subunit amino acid aminotransferase/4-amino-4-deoxychorismate lyase